MSSLDLGYWVGGMEGLLLYSFYTDVPFGFIVHGLGFVGLYGIIVVYK